MDKDALVPWARKHMGPLTIIIVMIHLRWGSNALYFKEVIISIPGGLEYKSGLITPSLII